MLPETFTPQFLRQLELFKLQSRRSYLGARQGGHVSLKRGHGIEFSDFRNYERGDNPRWIDWGVYARTDRLYVRRYREEQNLTVVVIIDTSASMHTPAEDRKWETARDVGLALGYVGLMQQDRVVMAPLGQEISPGFSGAKAIHAMAAHLMRPKTPFAANDLITEMQRAVSRVRFPGVAIFISDLLIPFVEIRRIFNVMLAKNLDITAIQVLGAHDLAPLPEQGDAIAIDSETGEEIQLALNDDSRGRYSYLLSTHNTQVREFFASRRIGYALATGGQSLSQFILSHLSRTGLLSS